MSAIVILNSAEERAPAPAPSSAAQSPAPYQHDHTAHDHHSVLEVVGNLLGADRYAEHSICLTNDPLIITGYVACDLTIMVSYFAIGFTLIAKRSILGTLSPAGLIMFGLFIFLCGLSHGTEILTMFSGVYRLDLAVSAATAGVSAITAAFVVKSSWWPKHERR